MAALPFFNFSIILFFFFFLAVGFFSFFFLHCWLGTNRGVHLQSVARGGRHCMLSWLVVHVLVSKICNNLLHQVHVFT